MKESENEISGVCTRCGTVIGEGCNCDKDKMENIDEALAELLEEEK